LGFQPAELSKLTLVLYLPVLLEKNKKLSIFLFIIGLFSLLIMLEPDLGTTIIVTATAFCLYFLSGAGIKNLLITVFLGLVSIPILIISSGYRRKRFMEFISSSLNNETSSYHLRQVLISLGSGGFLGRGFGQSRQKFLFLPEAATDSIFAIIAEDFGFLGASSIIIIFIILLVRGFKISISSLDYYGKMVCSGIIFFIMLQAFVNLSSVVSLIPITGVPLPFVSYGGSSLIVSLTGMGIVYNISRRTNN
jgi:cell division protein FtsW